VNRYAQHLTKEHLLSKAAPEIENMLKDTRIEYYVTAPIVSDELRKKFVAKSETRGAPHPNFFEVPESIVITPALEA
jgi:hypothetical protein